MALTITVDDRAGAQHSGSFDFPRQLKRQGVRTEVKRLPFGDFAMTGHGPAGQVRIGVERKTVEEVIDGLFDHRFVRDQLPGFIAAFDVRVLVIEGRAWLDPQSGLLMVGGREAGRTRQRHLWANYLKFRHSLAFKARLTIVPTGTKFETVALLASLAEWYEKRWSDHKSVYVVDENDPDYAILDERTFKRQLAAQLPGVGWERSRAVSKAFRSVAAMMNATEAEWRAALEIKDKRSKTAAKIVEWIHREEEAVYVSQMRKSIAVRTSRNVTEGRFGR
jgi:ERCC4-type nuclease